MLEKTTAFIDDGKKSLDMLLREKAYEEVVTSLQAEGIAISDVSDEEIEILVAEKVEAMKNGIKGFAIGSAVMLVVSSLFGF